MIISLLSFGGGIVLGSYFSDKILPSSYCSVSLVLNVFELPCCFERTICHFIGQSTPALWESLRRHITHECESCIGPTEILACVGQMKFACEEFGRFGTLQS